MKQTEEMKQEHHSFTLRFTQFTEGEDKYRVEIALEGGGLPRQTATSHFDFKLTDQDQEDIRWYLEDFLQYPHDPAPKIAARIEGRMAEIGTDLFRALFQSSDNAHDLWATLRTHLNETRVEIVTTVAEATTIPWELIRDPKTDTPIALRARSFVRAKPQVAQVPHIPQTKAGPIRILLVICRPYGRDDVPFRSVAIPLIKGLSEDARARFQLDVLRPPTFEQLEQSLHTAKAEGHPYHIVHFDGHGTYENMRGYLLFENADIQGNQEVIHGTLLGKTLAETGVPLLVLNACRSAHAEAPAKPGKSLADGRTRAFGSLAQEVMDAGAAGVVAMRYNVYVVTAAQFVADLYAALIQGCTLGEAVTSGRKQLDDEPLREIAYEPRPIQDWPVPVVYEATPISLFPAQDKYEAPTTTLSDDHTTPGLGGLDPKLPKRPDAGFFGRDETLLALDRAFDTQQIVLLHAYAGSGKTVTTGEFARWYALTGGVMGPVLFTSFEQYQPLTRVLDRIGDHFDSELERTGVHWLVLDDCERRNVALHVLKQKPVLWIWDNVEPVAGFPSGTKSAWSKEEQEELVDFLREVRDTRAKFLLISRRDERTWLGDLPARITIPPMPMWERVQLARAIAEKHGRRLTKIGDWRPLLEFTQGNPLTITVVVGQALRDGLRSKEQIEAFVERLRAGEAAFEDEVSEGRSRSLGASLSYGFEHAFSEDERRQLALLHFFQGFVNVDALLMMGLPVAEWCLPDVRGMTREAGIALLDRAAEIGLLTAIGGGLYTIHPAMPWFFKKLFDQYHASAAGDGEDLRDARRAFVETMSCWGNYYHYQYGEGNRDVVLSLTADEANLLHARKIARTHGWWRAVISTMQGLYCLYNQTGRRAEWARLVKEIVPDFMNPETDGPLQGREEEWTLITEYRIQLALEARHLAEAEHLQRTCVDWSRQRAAASLVAPPEVLDDAQQKTIRELSVSLQRLGEIQRELGQWECVATCVESFELAKRIGERAVAAICALNISKNLTLLVPGDLSQAERWCQHSLELRYEHDRSGNGRCLNQLGYVAFKRFTEAEVAKSSEKERRRHLDDALQFYQRALKTLPSDEVGDLSVAHNQLGNIYLRAGDPDHALLDYRKSIRYREIQGNLYDAAGARFNVAFALKQAGRFADALEYGRAALRNYETYGDNAAEMILRTQELIAQIEQAQPAQGG